MRRLLVDTNVLSYLMKGTAQGQLYLQHVDGHQVCICFVTVGELYCWAEHRGWSDAKRAQLEQRLQDYVILPYVHDLPIVYGRLRGGLLRRGLPCEPMDVWIAATAVSHGIPLVSHNRKHLEHVPGLTLISEAP